MIYALSRGGYLPTGISKTLSRKGFGEGCPVGSVITSALCSYALIAMTFLVGSTQVGSFLTFGSCFYGLLSAVVAFIGNFSLISLYRFKNQSSTSIKSICKPIWFCNTNYWNCCNTNCTDWLFYS